MLEHVGMLGTFQCVRKRIWNIRGVTTCGTTYVFFVCKLFESTFVYVCTSRCSRTSALRECEKPEGRVGIPDVCPVSVRFFFLMSRVSTVSASTSAASSSSSSTANTSNSVPLETGYSLSDFQVLKELTRSSSGAVVKARHRRSGKLVVSTEID